VYYNEHVDDAIGNSIPSHLEFLSALRSHHIPVTIIQGDHDYLDPSGSRWKAVQRRDPLVRVNAVPDACHYIWVDDSRAFAIDLNAGLSWAFRH